MLSDRYKPLSIEEFAGNKEAVAEALGWLKNWKDEMKKALLFYGPSGSGKSTLAQLLARKTGFALIETNASDVRSAGALKETFGASTQQRSLFFKGKLIVFDEVDGLSSGDRGGASELIKIIQGTAYPIILIANDAYEPKLKGLRHYCKLVKFSKVSALTIEKILERIVSEEKINVQEGVLGAIARTAGGDIKAAVNDLELLYKGKKIINKEDLAILGYRDLEKNIFESLRIIFKTEDAQTALEAMELTEKAPQEIIQWIRENIPLEYKLPEVAAAYDALSRADIFNGRIHKQQYWRFQSYSSQLMSIGVALAKKEKHAGFVAYQYPSRIASLGRTKIARAEENKILEALAKRLHCSKHEAKSYVPLLNLMSKKHPEEYENLMSSLNIEIKE